MPHDEFWPGCDDCTVLGLPEKNKQGSWEDIFEKTPGIFRFLTLPMEIPDKTRLHP